MPAATPTHPSEQFRAPSVELKPVLASTAESFPRTSVRVRQTNPNHHLWNNNGTWYLHYTVHPTPLTKSRVRTSLETKDVEVARQRRDDILRRAGVPLG